MQYDAEIVLGFIEEVEGYVPELRSSLAVLEIRAKDRDALDDCYRLAHTIKGTAAMMELPQISQQGQMMEQALLPVVEKKGPYTPDVGALLRNCVNRIEQMLMQVRREFESEAASAVAEPALPPSQPETAPFTFLPDFEPASILPAPAAPNQIAPAAFDWDNFLPPEEVEPFSWGAIPAQSAPPPPPVKPFAPSEISSNSYIFERPNPTPPPADFSKAHQAGFDTDFDFMQDLADLPGFIEVDDQPFTSKPFNQPEENNKAEESIKYQVSSNKDKAEVGSWKSESFTDNQQPTNNPSSNSQLATHNFVLDYFDLGPGLERQLALEQANYPAEEVEEQIPASLVEADLDFERFEPKIEENKPISNAYLSEFELADWLPATSSQNITNQPTENYSDPNLAELEKFSLDNILQADRESAVLAQPPQALPHDAAGFDTEPISAEIPTGEVDIYSLSNLPAYQSPEAFADFDESLASITFRAEPRLAPVPAHEHPDDFSEAADLLAQFDDEPGLFVDEPPFAALVSRTEAKSKREKLPPVTTPEIEPAPKVSDLPPLPEFNFDIDAATEVPATPAGLTLEEAAILAQMQIIPDSNLNDPETDFALEDNNADFEMGALWLAEAQGDITHLQSLISDFSDDENSNQDAAKIREIVTRLRKGADMMDLAAVARQLGILETAAEAVIQGELKPYMNGGDIFSYEMAALMIQLQPYEAGARAYIENVEAEQAEAEAAQRAKANRPTRSSDDFSFEPASLAPLSANQLAELADFDLASDAAEALPDTQSSQVDAEFAEVFAAEAEEHIQNLDMRLAQLERNPGNRELLREIRRTAHTLKGSAAMVGFNVISQTAHLMEDLLDRLFDNSLAVTKEVVQLLFQTFNAIDSMVRGLSQSRPEDAVKLQALRPLYAELLGGSEEEQTEGGMIIFEKKLPAPVAIRPTVATPPIARTISDAEIAELEAQAEQLAAVSVSSAGIPLDVELAVRIPIKRLDNMMNEVGELVINRTVMEQRNEVLARTVEELSLSIKRLQRVSRELETRYEVELLKNSATPLMSAGISSTSYQNGNGSNGSNSSYNARPNSTAEFDTLEMDQYTEFHTLSREMGETVADLAAAQRELDTLRSDLENVTILQSRTTDDLQDMLVKVRLVPLANLTPRLYRTLRTIAASEGKEVEFVVSGENTQVDKTIFEEIGDPLLHIIRNAIDHGIEGPQERLRRGKPTKGTISFSARSEGSQVVIDVRDDGTGLMAEELKQRAVERGLIKPDAYLTREEIFDLIFLPGFSTSVTISEISGRGIGMDVVRANVLKLKGSIEIQSEEGKGTAFIIRVPTTLAITRSILVRAGGYSYAIPLSVVEQTTRFETSSFEQAGPRSFYRFGGDALPYLELSQILRLPEHAERGPDDEDDEGPASMRKDQPLLIIGGSERVVLKVDQIINQQEVVVKNLGNHLKYVPGIIGASTLGSGEVILILNVYDLIAQAFGRRVGAAAITTQLGTAGRESWLKVRTELKARQGTTGMLRSRLSDRRTPLVQVVDDSLSMRKVLSSALEKAGYRVRTSKDGQEALETIQQSAPDLIIMDIEMPRMDGYELTALLKSRETYYNIPIVMLTSRAGLKHRQEAEKVGADGFLVKPYKEEELLQIVGTLLERAAVR